MYWEYQIYAPAYAFGLGSLLIAAIVVVVNAAVIRLAAPMVGAGRSAFGWCVAAAVITEFADALGHALFDGLLGAITAFALVALGYRWALQTTGWGAVGMVILVAAVRLLLLFALMAIGMGAMHRGPMMH